MAASNLNLGKASGGVLNVQPADGTTNTSIVLPASGTVTTNEYVNSNNLGNGSTTFNGFGGSGFKNYIINGGFDIWQRGTVFSTSGVFCADRWYQAIGGSAYSMLHNIYPSTILVATTAANSFLNLYQAIETVTVKKLRGKTVTVSLKLQVGGTHTGGFALTARYSNSTDALVNQTTTIQSMGISATTTNTRYSLTFVVPSDAVGLRIDLENTVVQANGALYQVQEVQLEQGSIATPFEQRPYGLELSLCQRYYYKMLNNIWVSKYATAGYSVAVVPLPMTMLTIPTITQTNNQNVNPVGLNYNGACVSLIYQFEPLNGMEVTSFTVSAEL